MDWAPVSHKIMKTGREKDRNINAQENLSPEMTGENVLKVSSYRV